MPGQHLELTDNERHLAVARSIEDEGDFALPGLLHSGDVSIIDGVAGAVLLEGLHGKDHVVDSNRLAVVMTRAGAQTECCRRKVVRVADGLGEQAIIGGHFVERRRQQGSQMTLAPIASEPFTPPTTSLKLSKVPKCRHPHHAQLRRVGIDVVETREAGRVFELSEQRQAVPPCGPLVARLRGGWTHKHPPARFPDQGEQNRQAAIT
jgi:hypothetical protein